MEGQIKLVGEMVVIAMRPKDADRRPQVEKRDAKARRDTAKVTEGMTRMGYRTHTCRGASGSTLSLREAAVPRPMWRSPEKVWDARDVSPARTPSRAPRRLGPASRSRDGGPPPDLLRLPLPRFPHLPVFSGSQSREKRWPPSPTPRGLSPYSH
ncbi:hypothetical protein BHM03_00018445 [Ensete ventricosum]|nr:hypothetical protein BHM03_00018445 [Ensete ventricosum]